MTKLATANGEALTADELDHVVAGSIVYQYVAEIAVKSQQLPLTPAHELLVSFGR